MLCQNCGKNEANIKYTQIINGVKKQMTLCSSCAEKLGLEDIGFDMPINFSSFLGDVFEDTATSFIPDIVSTKSLACDKCNMTYDEFTNVGKFGCEHCYETFENKIDLVLKSIQGSNRHVGRLGNKLIENEEKKVEQINKKKDEKISEEDKKENQIKKLQERLKQEIIEERYEDAAKTRDEIKQLQGK